MNTTESCREILANPNDKLISVDLDGTLTTGEYWGGVDTSEPRKDRIEFINNLYKNGAHIIIYTARFPDMCGATMAWLLQHGVLYHGLCMQKKPGSDLYLDDKSLNAEELD